MSIDPSTNADWYNGEPTLALVKDRIRYEIAFLEVELDCNSDRVFQGWHKGLMWALNHLEGIKQ